MVSTRARRPQRGRTRRSGDKHLFSPDHRVRPRWGARWVVLLVHLARPPRPPMGIPRAAVSPCRVLQSIDWEGEQALLELTLVDARTVFGCAPTRGPGGRERWAHLAGEVTSYPQRCAEHGGPRSASAPTSSVSAFFSAFFRSCARARSTGRAGTVLEYGYF